jgi:hypothetical protein
MTPTTAEIINIAVVNESTVLSDPEVVACVQALQLQCDEDYTPNYGVSVSLVVLAKGEKPSPEEWELAFLDDSDQAGALGYHETTAHGMPIGFAFAKTALDAGESWTVTASHELLEMLQDPQINTSMEVDNADGSTTFHFKEICDPCEDDSYAYTKTDSLGNVIKLPVGEPVRVSDFVLPGYWDPQSAGDKFSFRGNVTKQLEVLPGGYTSTLQVPSEYQWQQITNQKAAGARTQREAPQPFSRRSRHLIKRSNWKASGR